MIYHGSYSFKTDVGKVRSDNEDQAAIVTNGAGEVLLIVCDGMGGANKGDVASRIAVSSMVNSFSKRRTTHFGPANKRWMTKAAKAANKAVYKAAQSNKAYSGMGTTLVAVLISGEKCTLLNIGDSRAYALKDGELHQISTDQTYVRYLINTGKIKEEEASTHPERHVLMNALGVYPSLSLSIDSFPYHGESILLCSDGLYNQLSEGNIQSLIATDERADQKVASLIMAANDAGGSDNIGIAYWESDND